MTEFEAGGKTPKISDIRKVLEAGFEAKFENGQTCKYTPFQKGRLIGYKMEVEGETTFVTLNPSDCGDGPDIFVYRGKTGDPEFDLPICYLVPG